MGRTYDNYLPVCMIIIFLIHTLVLVWIVPHFVIQWPFIANNMVWRLIFEDCMMTMSAYIQVLWSLLDSCSIAILLDSFIFIQLLFHQYSWCIFISTDFYYIKILFKYLCIPYLNVLWISSCNMKSANCCLLNNFSVFNFILFL